MFFASGRTWKWGCFQKGAFEEMLFVKGGECGYDVECLMVAFHKKRVKIELFCSDSDTFWTV